MPFDSSSEYLTAAQRETVAKLKAAFADRRFKTGEAAMALGREKASASSSLNSLVLKGAAFRVDVGTFCMVNHNADAQERGSDPSPKTKIFIPLTIKFAPQAPISSVDQALAWFKGNKISVERIGERFLIDNRLRVTAEQLVITAERRRVSVGKYPPEKPRLVGHLPTSIPEPTIKQLMRGR